MSTELRTLQTRGAMVWERHRPMTLGMDMGSRPTQPTLPHAVSMMIWSPFRLMARGLGCCLRLGSLELLDLLSNQSLHLRVLC